MNRSNFKLARLTSAILTLVLGFASQSRGDQSPVKETPEQHDARMKWFREARFGMFIHWGLYSAAAGQWDGRNTTGAGEWIMNDLRIPDSQYAKLVAQFNPVKFDARKWVALATNAGMKYIVITSKHHEGFAMYPSALTDWSIKSTPFQRDPLKELAEACQEAKIKLCFYHSIMDWHHPDYLPRKPWNDLANPDPNFDRYVSYMKGQLKELLTGYGPIGILWFDGQWENSWTYDRGLDLDNYVRGLQPNIIVNNRVGPGQPPLGDYGTPEQFIPASGYGKGIDWETCMTMNDTWGFKKEDENWKASETLIRNLIDVASKGGNYLLNVGPTAEGLIPDASVDRLQAIGKWMRVNRESISGTTASPFTRQLPWGRCTRKVVNGVTFLYFHVFEWPTNGVLKIPGLKTKPRKAWPLGGRISMAGNVTEEGLEIGVPTNAVSPISTTVVAQFLTPVEISPVFTMAQSNGSIVLNPLDAQLHGDNIRCEQSGGRDNIGFWTNPGDWVDWNFKVRAPGRFQVHAEVAALEGSSFDVLIGGKTLHGSAPKTSGYQDYRIVDLGSVEIPAGSLATLALRAVKDGWQPIDVRSIQLTPLTPTP